MCFLIEKSITAYKLTLPMFQDRKATEMNFWLKEFMVCSDEGSHRCTRRAQAHMQAMVRYGGAQSKLCYRTTTPTIMQSGCMIPITQMWNLRLQMDDY